MNGNGAAAPMASDKNPPPPIPPPLTRAEKRASEKVDGGFLLGLEKKLGVSPTELITLLGCSDATFYKYRIAGVCPAWMRDAADAALEARGLPKTKHAQPKARAAAKPSAPPKVTKADRVPSGFLNGIEAQLGISNSELCRLLGVKSPNFAYWRKSGFCPSIVRTAVNGLLAERRVIDGDAVDVRDPPRRQVKAQVPAVLQRPVPGVPLHGDIVLVHVMVPREQVPVVSAMLAGLGYPIQVGK